MAFVADHRVPLEICLSSNVHTGVVAALGDFYDSLNPAQQQKVREFLQKRRGWHRG